MNYPTPHGDKLRALLENDKLPRNDRSRVKIAIERYEAWITEIKAIEFRGEHLVETLVESLNRYKSSLELDLIFDCKDDFFVPTERPTQARQHCSRGVPALAGWASVRGSSHRARLDARSYKRLLTASS